MSSIVPTNLSDLISLSQGIRQLSWEKPLTIEREDLNVKVHQIWEQRHEEGDTATKAYLEDVLVNLRFIRPTSDLTTIACALDDLAYKSIIRNSSACRDIFEGIIIKVISSRTLINSDEIADFAYSCRKIGESGIKKDKIIAFYDKLFDLAKEDFSKFTTVGLARTIKGFVQAFFQSEDKSLYYLSIKTPKSVKDFFKNHIDAVKQKMDLFEATEVADTIWSYGYAYEKLPFIIETKDYIQRRCKDTILELAKLAEEKVTNMKMSYNGISKVCANLGDIGARSNRGLIRALLKNTNKGDWGPIGVVTMLKFAAREESNPEQKEFFTRLRSEFLDNLDNIYDREEGENHICRGAHSLLIEACSPVDNIDQVDNSHQDPIKKVLDFIAKKTINKPANEWNSKNVSVIKQLFLFYTIKFDENSLKDTALKIRGFIQVNTKNKKLTKVQGQNKIIERLNILFNKVLFTPEVDFEGIYSIDIGSKDLEIAIEYDGQTHFDFKKCQRKEDYIKEKLLRLKGWDFFRIRSDDWNSFRTEEERNKFLKDQGIIRAVEVKKLL